MLDLSPWELAIVLYNLERGTGFEPVHPRVEALVHSLFYVTPADEVIDRKFLPRARAVYKKWTKSQSLLQKLLTHDAYVLRRGLVLRIEHADLCE